MIVKFLKFEISKQAIRFLLVGTITTLINYSIFLLLSRFFNIYFVIAAVVGYLLGLTLGYLLNRIFTFESTENIMRSTLIYFFVNAISIGLIIFTLPEIVKVLRISPHLAYFIMLIITTIINFFGSKILAFKNKKWI